jgi:predicted PhzF superfamily epimerase YddE/YHI9
MLSVTREKNWLVMDFPVQAPVACDVPEMIVSAFQKNPVECLQAEDYVVVFGQEGDVEAARPNFEALRQLDLRGVIITAASARYDFVARFFAPKYGVDEDPVTGSAYTQLAPYWASRLGPKKFRAKQVSPRGGELMCEVVDNRVFIYGQAVKYLEGKIEI